MNMLSFQTYEVIRMSWLCISLCVCAYPSRLLVSASRWSSPNNPRWQAKDHLNSVLPTREREQTFTTLNLPNNQHISTEAYDQIDKLNATETIRTPVVCNGTVSKLSARTNSAAESYKLYKSRYENCEIVNGNLELVQLSDPARLYDMSFLNNIRKVTGYILIFQVFARTIPLLSLETIGGEYLYKENSIWVELNQSWQDEDLGIYEMQLPSLVEITQGDVTFKNNNNLCHLETIRWNEIMKDRHSNLRTSRNRGGRFRRVRACGRCDGRCLGGACWGVGPAMCQALQNDYYYN